MKRLLLIRHAKSSWEHQGLSDHQRPLANRGLRDAPEMGKRLLARKVKPDMILSSNAVRAMETALLIAKELSFPIRGIKRTDRLYHASARAILSTIKDNRLEGDTLFVIGHNPGMNDFIALMGGEIDNLPTSGQYGFSFDVSSWGEVSPEKAHFWFLDYPKLKFPDIL